MRYYYYRFISKEIIATSKLGSPAEDLFKHPMHPYTISLLSAVPQPDPDYEKGRKRLFYDPRMHDYRFDRPSFREIGPNHFVLANDKEFKQMKIEYNKVK